MALDTLKNGLAGLFGQGSSKQTRAKSAHLDLISPERLPDGALAGFWELLDGRMPRTVDRIRKVRALMVGDARAARGAQWFEADSDSDADGPDKYEIPRKTAKRLASKKSTIKRPASGLTPTAVRVSTRIEQFANGYLDETFPDFEVTEMALNEAETLMITVPMPIHWAAIPTLYDEWEDEGKHISQDAYDQLPDRRRREYERANPSGDTAVYKRMRKRYRLDRHGEPDSGDDHETDLHQSARFFSDELEDAYARHLPILLRGPISRLDFIPINPTFRGKITDVDGVIIRTLYRRSKLLRDYAFDNAHDLLEPIDSYDGQDGDFWLYELWAYDEDRRPYVAYQVGTRGTRWADTGTTAVIRLDEAFPGITELPIAFEYGNHTTASNPDLRTLPFPLPYRANWLQRDKILSNLGVSVDTFAYPAFGQLLTKDSLEVLAALPGDIDVEFRFEGNTIKPIVGQLVPLNSGSSTIDLKVLLEALDALNRESLPQAGAFGGEGPTSGLDRQVIGRDTEIAFSDVIECVRRIKERCGRHGLMVASALGRACDRPVELYVTGDAPSPQAGGAASSATRSRISLPPDLCGDNWDVMAVFPHIPGENLAASSLYLTALEKGAILMREWREVGWGDPHPENFLAEKVLEDYFLKTPAGQLDALQGMAEYLADDRLKKMLALAQNGTITSAQGGVSTDAMNYLTVGGPPGAPPRPGGPPTSQPGSAAPGMVMPNPAQSALAGGNAGALAASAASAGSPLDGGQAGMV